MNLDILDEAMSGLESIAPHLAEAETIVESVAPIVAEAFPRAHDAMSSLVAVADALQGVSGAVLGDGRETPTTNPPAMSGAAAMAAANVTASNVDHETLVQHVQILTGILHSILPVFAKIAHEMGY